MSETSGKGKECSAWTRKNGQLDEFIVFCACTVAMEERNFDQSVLVTVLKYKKYYDSTRVNTYGEAIDWLKAQAKKSGFNVHMPKVKNNGKGYEKELVAEFSSQFAGGTPKLLG